MLVLGMLKRQYMLADIICIPDLHFAGEISHKNSLDNIINANRDS